MTFYWKDKSPLTFPSDFADGCRLPRYVVSFATQPNTHIIYYGESKSTANIIGTHSEITLRILLFYSQYKYVFVLSTFKDSNTNLVM